MSLIKFLFLVYFMRSILLNGHNLLKMVNQSVNQWVADGSPTHSTPVKIDNALQFVPTNTNPREFKRIQQQVLRLFYN